MGYVESEIRACTTRARRSVDMKVPNSKLVASLTFGLSFVVALKAVEWLLFANIAAPEIIIHEVAGIVSAFAAFALARMQGSNL